MSEADQYAVVGNPVEHSKSPQIHALFAEQTEQSLEYTTLFAEADMFSRVVDDFRSGGGLGLNVTIPFKRDAWHYADRKSEKVRLSGAANILVFNKEGVFADNTDGTGLVNDMVQNHSIALVGSNILVLGAGGAVRGTLGPLLEQKPVQVTIANRTVEKAIALGEQFSGLGNISACGLNELDNGSYDLIINGTAASLDGLLPSLPDGILANNGSAYDMMYAREATPFMAWAEQQTSGKILDGLGMLVEQAAESFYIWRNVRPATRSVIKAIRQSM